jgi:hypothetical protein
MQADEIYCELVILDCDDPQKITGLLEIEPSKIVKKGDIKNADPKGIHAPVLEKRHAWIWMSSLPTNTDVEDHISFMLKQLSPKANILAQLSKEYALELALYGYAYHSQVGMHISAAQLKKIADMGLELDLDIYSLE